MGIAYLDYPSTENRFVTLAAPTLAVHGAWNDLGVQVYAIAPSFNLVVYWVDGSVFVGDLGADAKPEFAAGGRLGLLPFEILELGASVARIQGQSATRQTLFGADVALRTGTLELQNEYLARRSDGTGDVLQGFYSQVSLGAPPGFGVARFETVLATQQTLERQASVGLGATLLAEGELRAVYQHSFESGARQLFLQVVGGSAWQPTGLRR
jgi:hypothetical protein